MARDLGQRQRGQPSGQGGGPRQSGGGGGGGGQQFPGGKRRKRKKRKRDAPSPNTEPSRWAALRGRWWILLVAIGILELYLFGSRGHVQVCVAREGVHDFSLLGSERTDDNTHRFPTCEDRLNIGITSHFDEVVESATIHACTRANILRSTTEKAICVIKQDGWQHRVGTSWCPPWHDHYYKRLFWFAFPDD